MAVVKLQGKCTVAMATGTNTDLVNIQYIYKKIKTKKKGGVVHAELILLCGGTKQRNTQEKKMCSVTFN